MNFNSKLHIGHNTMAPNTNYIKINKPNKLIPMQLNQDTCFNSSTNSSLNYNFNSNNNLGQFVRPNRISACNSEQNQMPHHPHNVYLTRKNSLHNKRNEFEKSRENMNRFSAYNTNSDKYSRSVIEGSISKRFNMRGAMDRQRNVQMSESESDDTKSLLFSELSYDTKKHDRRSQILNKIKHSNSGLNRSNESLTNGCKRHLTVHHTTNKENDYDNHAFYNSSNNNSRNTPENDLSSLSYSTMNRGSINRNTLNNINNPGYYPNPCFQQTLSRCSNNNHHQDDISVISCHSKHRNIYGKTSRPATNFTASSSNESIDLTSSSHIVRKKILLDGSSTVKRRANVTQYHNTSENMAGNSTYYSRDFLKPNIRMGEIENSSRLSSGFDKPYENFAKLAEKKILRSNLKPGVQYMSKGSHKTMTMNPSIMRKMYGAKESFDSSKLDKKFDELFIQAPKNHRADKSYSEAEFKDETRTLSRNSFGSMMSIPIQMRAEEFDTETRNLEAKQNKSNTRLVLGKNQSADFTPQLISNGKSSSSKETNHKTTPTNSNIFLPSSNKSTVESSPVVPTSSNNSSVHIVNSINKNLCKQQQLQENQKMLSHHQQQQQQQQQQFKVIQPTEKASHYIDVASKNSLNNLAQKMKNMVGTESMGTLSRNLNSELSTGTNKERRNSKTTSTIITNDQKFHEITANVERKVVATNDYYSLYTTNISLKKGEKYTLINQDNNHWFFVKDQFGNTGYAPANHLEILYDYDNMPMSTIGVNQATNKSKLTHLEKEWFHNNLTRSQAYSLLVNSQSENGTYLVRNNSSDKGKFTLCVYKNGKVYNYKINNEDDKLFLSQKHKFNDLIELVEFYKKNSAGLISNLKYALERTSPPAVGSDEGSTSGTKAPSSVVYTNSNTTIYKKFTIDRRDIEFFEKIGSGQFGVVLKAEYRQKKMVAVKKMKPGSKEDEVNFRREAEFMMKLQNLQESTLQRNLVQFVGISKDYDDSILIVTEYVKYGSLYNHLIKHKERIVSSKSRILRLLNICIDVCDGMEYLESNNIIHRDLATRNCLVGDGEIIKVADYGLARFTESSYIAHPQSQFPVKWSAPEVIKHRSYSNKSDVWSFSCLMYEVFTLGKMPYGGSTINSVAAKQIISGIIPEKPFYCPTSLYENVLKKAWNKDPKERPSFKELMKLLVGFIN